MKTQQFIISFILLFAISIAAEGAEDKPLRYYLHSVVDTTRNPEFVGPIEHWVDFLYETNPIEQNKYWDPAEVRRLQENFCIFCGGFFQYGREKTMNYFRPYILSVEDRNDKYIIRTMFATNPMAMYDSVKYNQNPAAIIRIIVKEHDGKYYLKNYLYHGAKIWQRFEYENFTYFVEPTMEIDTSAVRRAKAYCDSLSMIWRGEEFVKPVDYFVAPTYESITEVAGLDFAFIGGFVGKGFSEAGLLLSGSGDFCYEHELAHIALIQSDNMLFSEGLATYFAGSSGTDFPESVRIFYNNHYPLTEEKIESILKWTNSKRYYTFAALLAEMVIREQGIGQLKQLRVFSGSDEEYIDTIAEMLGISRAEMIDKINARLENIK